MNSKARQAFRMRDYCNPFQTCKAFGKDRREAATGEIMAMYNRPWPASQPADPISLPPIASRSCARLRLGLK